MAQLRARGYADKWRAGHRVNLIEVEISAERRDGGAVAGARRCRQIARAADNSARRGRHLIGIEISAERRGIAAFDVEPA